MATKNVMGRSRKPGNPYMTTEDPRTGWRYEVLKTYQVDGTKPYARAFCNVHGWAEEMGDVYVADIGRTLVDFDRSIFPNATTAVEALFGYLVLDRESEAPPECSNCGRRHWESEEACEAGDANPEEAR